MIADIPTQDDFERSGISLLNLAWDLVLQLMLQLADAEIDQEEDNDTIEKYWEASQSNLSTALALVQQGTEFLLKGRIAAISPYLLLSGNPQEWPRGCDRSHTSFSQFRSIDAQDLIRVHDTIALTRLSDDFKTNFNRMRLLRNTTMHTVDRRIKITSKEVLREILDTTQNLIRPQSWVPLRRTHLDDKPQSLAYKNADLTDYNLAREVTTVIDALEPSLTKKYLNFNKRQRAYYCYPCLLNCQEFFIKPKLAQLHPNETTSTNIHCILCGESRQVERERCHHQQCKGNVIDLEDNVCLTCGE